MTLLTLITHSGIFAFIYWSTWWALGAFCCNSDGWGGWDHTTKTVLTTRATAVLKTNFYVTTLMGCLIIGFVKHSDMFSLYSSEFWVSYMSSFISFIVTLWFLGKGSKNGNFEWHLPWRGRRESRVPLTFFSKMFFVKPIKNNSLTVKTCFAHSLVFILYTYSTPC